VNKFSLFSILVSLTTEQDIWALSVFSDTSIKFCDYFLQLALRKQNFEIMLEADRLTISSLHEILHNRVKWEIIL